MATALFGASLALAVLIATPGMAAASTAISFSYTGAVQTWTVPSGVASITIDLAGAQGGSFGSSSPGGMGGRVQGSLSVSPGEVLSVYVAGAGESGINNSPAVGGFGIGTGGTGYANGSGGGGASGIANNNTALAIAPGGGGDDPSVVAGAGGGLTGGAGTSYGTGTPATGGTQSAGGTGGTSGGQAGSPGSGHNGGNGGQYSDNYGGSGGGGGYFGGGGGAGDGFGTIYGFGGGGGGSALVPAGGTTTSGYQAGNGYVTITYTALVAPSITSPASATFQANQSNSFTITSLGSPTAAISESGSLPAGVTFTDNGNDTATISGDPASNQDGSWPITISASNTQGTATQAFTLKVQTTVVGSNISAGGNATVLIGAGTLGFCAAPTDISFGTTTLNGQTQIASASLPLDVCDATGSGAGWRLDATSLPFTSSTGHSLPTDATTVLALPAVVVDTGATGAIPASNTITYPYALPSALPVPAATPVFAAAASSGLGAQTITPTFTLAVPANAYVGLYSSTWTFTIITGP